MRVLVRGALITSLALSACGGSSKVDHWTQIKPADEKCHADPAIAREEAESDVHYSATYNRCVDTYNAALEKYDIKPGDIPMEDW